MMSMLVKYQQEHSIFRYFAHTRCEVAVILLYHWTPAFSNHCRVPESRSWGALSKDECNANNADNKEGRDYRVQKPRLTLTIAYYSQHQYDNGDLAEACAHNMESLGDPVELHGHHTLMST